ncbi:hypothetical protein BS78_K214800, partial [Paspalum vaginatum]
CSFSRHVWFLVLRVLSWQSLVQESSDNLMTWWSSTRKRVVKEYRPGLDGLVLLVTWTIWKERNARVFSRGASSPHEILSKVLDEAKLWNLAGFCAFHCLASI